MMLPQWQSTLTWLRAHLRPWFLAHVWQVGIPIGLVSFGFAVLGAVAGMPLLGAVAATLALGLALISIVLDL